MCSKDWRGVAQFCVTNLTPVSFYLETYQSKQNLRGEGSMESPAEPRTNVHGMKVYQELRHVNVLSGKDCGIGCKEETCLDAQSNL